MLKGERNIKIININDKEKNNKIYTVASIFCGAGGLDMGFQTVWANDIDEDACITHSQWSNVELVCRKIENIDFFAH